MNQGFRSNLLLGISSVNGPAKAFRNVNYVSALMLFYTPFWVASLLDQSHSAAEPVSTLNICDWHLARIVPTGCTFVRGLNSDAFRIQEGVKVPAWVPY